MNSNVRQAVGTSKLSLSYGKPHKPVSSSAFSRWQNDVSCVAGKILQYLKAIVLEEGLPRKQLLEVFPELIF